MPKTTPVPQALRSAVHEYHDNFPGMSARKIADSVGLHHKTVSRILKQYLDEQIVSDIHAGEAEPAPLLGLTTNEEPDGQWIEAKDYVYNGQSDSYVTVLRCRPKPLVMTGTKMRALRKAYSSWDGGPATLNELCRRFAIPRDQMTELRQIYGFTHDSEPYTREEVMTREVDDLADDAFQQRRQAIWEGFEKKKWHQTKEDAQKWNNLEQNFMLPLQDHLSTLIPSYEPPRINLKLARNPFAVVTSAGELHYGGSGWVLETGEEFNRADAEERLIYARTRMLEEVADKGRPEKFFYCVGHDFLTVDTDFGTTTKGTPQEMDGTAAQILAEGFDLAVRDIDALRSVSRIQILSIPGNHDRLLTVALLKFLQAWYRNQDDVEIEFSAKSRSYAAYGDTLLGFAHGDGALKPAQYMATMALEAPSLWANTVWRAFFTGHLHHEVVRELVGGTHYQMPSLRGRDRFHERNAFLSQAALASYVVDRSKGVTSTIYTRV
jgi:DNA-binding Lrp family transcriptional regulator